MSVAGVLALSATDAASVAQAMKSSQPFKFEEPSNRTYTATAARDRAKQVDYTILESIPVAMGMAAPAVAMAVWESTFSLSSMSPKAQRGRTANASRLAWVKQMVGVLNQTAPDLPPAGRKRLAVTAGLRGTANIAMETASTNYPAPAAFAQSLDRGHAVLEMLVSRSLLAAVWAALLASTSAKQARQGLRLAQTGPENAEKDSDAMSKKLLSCSLYDTKELCLHGERRMRCDWHEFYKCKEREGSPVPDALSGPECEALDTMNKCQTAFGCVYDSVSGQCHATPSICERITCGEERQPPEPVTCLPPLKKTKPEGSCCFICTAE